MVTSTINIKAPAEKIWQALTDKEMMKEWYFDIPDFKLREGLVFNFYEPGNTRQFHHRCRIREVVPNERFSHTWTHPTHSKGESLVTWQLQENSGTTQVTLIHEGIENLADGGPDFAAENYQMGWDGFMYVLKNYINGIRKHTYSIKIKASPERLWAVLFEDRHYRNWASAFSPGSHIKGRLEVDGKHVHFLDSENNGVYSRVIFWISQKQAMFQHIGNVESGEEQPVDEMTEKWSGAFETYSLTEEANGFTKLTVEVDFDPVNQNYFDETYEKAFNTIKYLAE